MNDDWWIILERAVLARERAKQRRARRPTLIAWALVISVYAVLLVDSWLGCLFGFGRHGGNDDLARNDVLEIERLSEMYTLQKSGLCPRDFLDLKRPASRGK